MPVFLIPDASRPNDGIGICDRCKRKRFLNDLEQDRNYPGLRVCKGIENGCSDVFDPWRLPPRQTEQINLPFVRPDVPIPNTPDAANYTVNRQGDLEPNTGFTPEV